MKRALAALVALALVSSCGSPEPKPPNAISGPKDALQLGMGFYRDDEYAAAEQMFLRALNLYQSVDDRAGQVTALVNLADVALVLGEHERALTWIEPGRELARRDGLTELGARLVLLQAQALAQGGKNEEAATLLQALLAGDAAPQLRQAATLERARVALATGDKPEDWLRRAHELITDHDESRLRAGLLRLDAESARRSGDGARAAQLLEQALASYKADFYRPGIAATNEELAALAVAAHDASAAGDRYARALAIRFWLHDRVHGAGDLDALGAIEEARGDKTQAAQHRALLAELRAPGEVDWPGAQAKLQQAGL